MSVSSIVLRNRVEELEEEEEEDQEEEELRHIFGHFGITVKWP